MNNTPEPHDDPLWKDPLVNPQREHDPVTDPNVNGDRKRPTGPGDINHETYEPKSDPPTPLSDERR
ncbi:hypothetical protein [Pseudomonas japonica]|uniref:Uncharacterized protein n=1 Tax=Pseudomonas japonica TaxID=256466 RepID=A0A239I4I3_9PSED|nr:hypothetical protein [Pseudomonas japonica]SNS87983.1 hypothetical protein SAMN05444352_11788 [Pseudomonas japonica]